MAAKGTDHWTDQEHGVLLECADWPAAAVARRLGRSVHSVYQKRHRLRHGWVPEIEGWTAEELDFLRSTPHLTQVEQAARLPGRTYFSVGSQRRYLTRTEGIRFDAYNKNPNHVGGRLLLARTCPDCGLLLDARFYGISGRGRRQKFQWYDRCVRCRQHGRARVQSDESKAKTAANVKALQDRVADQAVRRGQPWLEADDRVIQDPDLTNLEKAIRLKRTLQATQARVHKVGATSANKRHLGPTQDGVWVIQFQGAA